MPEGANGCQWVPTGDCRCLLASEGAYWCLWVPNGGAHRYLRVPIGI